MRYIGKREVDEIFKMHAAGTKMKDIATIFNISESTVSNYVNGRTTPRYLKRRAGRPKVVVMQKLYAAPDFAEDDFSKYDDAVLFHHVKECNFIG